MKSFKSSLNFLLLSMLTGAAPIFASSGDSLPPPSPPYVAAIPIPSSWTVTTSAPKVGEASATPRLVSTRFTYVLDLRRGISLWSDGHGREEWLTKGFLVTRQNAFLYLLDSRLEVLNTSLSAQSFTEFSWVSAANFIGREKIQGRECDVFREGEKTAAVDAETKLPVQLILSGEISNYSFGEPEDLKLPADCAERIASYLRERQKLSVNRAPR